MVLVATDVSVGAMFAIIVLGVASLMAGLTIVVDWRGWGARSYRFTIHLPLPGAGFYRDWGFGTYRTLVGGGGVVMGLVLLAVAIVALVRLLV